MQAGNLRSQITIQERSKTPDSFGGQSPLWKDVYKVRCFAQPTGGSEAEHGGAVRALQKYLFTIRYGSAPDVSPAHRIVFNGQFFDITAVNDVDSRHREIQIQAQQGLADG